MRDKKNDKTETIERFVEKKLADYFETLGNEPARGVHAMVMNEVERTVVRVALGRSGWNQTAAAEVLGLSRNTLRNKIKSLGIEPPES